MNCPYCGYVENSAGPTHVCSLIRRATENAALRAESDLLKTNYLIVQEENARLRAERDEALADNRIDVVQLDALLDEVDQLTTKNAQAIIKEECRIKDACPYKSAIEDALMLEDMSSSGSAREDLNRLLCAAEDSAANQIKIAALQAECEDWKRSAINLADTVKMLATHQHKPSV